MCSPALFDTCRRRKLRSFREIVRRRFRFRSALEMCGFLVTLRDGDLKTGRGSRWGGGMVKNGIGT